jgi:hypothetical protein
MNEQQTRNYLNELHKWKAYKKKILNSLQPATEKSHSINVFNRK